MAYVKGLHIHRPPLGLWCEILCVPWFSTGSFISMESLADVLRDPHSSLPLIRTTSAQRLHRSSNLSLSSDEGLGLSDMDGSTTSPELGTSPFASPAPTKTVGESSRADGKVVAGGRKSSEELADTSVHLPPVSQPGQTNADVSSVTTSRRTSIPTIHKLSVDEDESVRKASIESIPADEPQRRRSRRRASKVLQFALATSDKTMHVPSLLERYQVCSLACCGTLSSCAALRELITTAPRNTEGQNYKLSYEREPQ